MSLDDRTVYQFGLRRNFPAFLRKCFQHLNPGESYLDNWHVKAISHRLNGVRRDHGGRLLVTVPPRSLKSVTISVAWVAWMLGKDPRLTFVCVSYSADLALKHARDCRSILQSDWYRALFPKTVLQRVAESDLETTEGGGRISTSVGGTLTGRGGDLIIIDDPIKPDEAASESTRRAAIEWFRSTLSTRLNDKLKGSIIVVMQRLHQDDLAGHLIEAGGWDHLNFPAIATRDETIPIGPTTFHTRAVGDVLHPEREPLSLLEAQRGTMGSALFSAQYQQEPVPADGNIVKREWLQRYTAPLVRQAGEIIVQSWDCASKDGVQNDWSVCITALLRDPYVYILDVYRARLQFPDLYRQVEDRARQFQAHVILVEDAASGTQLIQQLRRREPQGVPLPTRIQPAGDKVTRMSGASIRIERGEMVLPDEAPWLASFEVELLGFPAARHDDQVDALSQLLNWRRLRLETLPEGGYTFEPDDDYDEFDEFEDAPDRYLF